ncbi:MAG: prepilin-type N-terminal cleavage/methylation domain-containing protein [Elusimicrobiaceae bacterium]|nr:prepilin-type N-terminal cleavage/methylation domain-containing protein [Elusimicrobiaceae bacterium]
MCRRIFVKNKSNVKRGFTLVELLIVVLIVGILVSVALPLYQNAVDKSRWAKLLSPSRAIANAEEAVLMSNGAYTVNKEDLVVSLPNDSDLHYDLYTTENGDDGNLVRVTSDKLDNVRLARYYVQNENLPGKLFCEALNGNARAEKLCGKLLQGQKIFDTDDGYGMYVLNEDAKTACGSGLFWSNNFNTCYKTEQERCTANGMDYTTFCGYENDYDKTVKEGGVCRTTVDGSWSSTSTGPCYNTTIESGGKCFGDSKLGCGGATVLSGGECHGTQPHGCFGVTVQAGGTCIGDTRHTCYGSYYGGTCIGNADKSCGGAELPWDKVEFYEGATCIGNASGACSSLTYFKTGSKCIAKADGACQGDYSQGGCCVSDGGTCPAGTECQS